MIEIKKGREPQDLIDYRKKKFASYAGMPKNVKEKVLESLMKEQGHLCAYCMRKIPEKRAELGVTIEHWAAQSENDIQMGLDYRNMLAVCSGNRGCGSDKYMTCDAKRGNQPLKVNPLKPETLREIKYDSEGRISSSDPIVAEDINRRLNLNCAEVRLPENRLAALRAMQKELLKYKSEKEYVSQCRRYLNRFCEDSEKKREYVGILIWWLEKRLHRATG